MFSNFKNAFKKEKNTLYEIPRVLLDKLNNQLPDGFEYFQIDNNLCTIKPVNTTHKIALKLQFDNPLQLNDTKQILQYLYRTQKSAEVISNTIELDDHQVSIDMLFQQPLTKENFKLTNGKLLLEPKPFPDPFDLDIGYNDKTKVFKFKRMPYEDLHKTLFQSINMNSLVISFIIDEVSDKMEIKLSIDISKAETTSEIIEAYSIYKSFMDNSGKIGDTPLNTGLIDHNEEEGLDLTIEFWRKVDLIGKKLNVSFKPTTIVNRNNLELINKLYRCLIENEAYKETFNSFDDLTITTSGKFNSSHYANGGDFTFNELKQKHWEIFGVELNLIEISYWFNIKISSVIPIKNETCKYKLVLDNKSNIKVSRVVKYFQEESAAKIFMDSIVNYTKNDLEKIKIL